MRHAPCFSLIAMTDRAQQSEKRRGGQREETTPPPPLSGDPGAPREPIPARDPFVRRVAVVVFFVVVAGLLLTVFIMGIEVLLAAFAGVLLAVFLRALTELLSRYTPLSDGISLAVVLLLLLVLIAGGGVLLAPSVAEQADEVSQQLPGMLAELEEFLQQWAWGQWLLDQVQNGEMPEGMTENIGAFVGGLLSWFTYSLVVLFVGLFGAANPQLYQDGMVRLFPLRHRPRARELVGELGYTLRWWLIGRAVAMLMVGVTTWIVLALLGIRFALLLGIIAGLFTFVPYLGPIAAGVPIILFALMDGPEQALWAFLAYFAIQMVEGNVLDPLIMHALVYIPPVVTIIMQVLMGAVVGVMGIIMATPLAAVLIVLTKFYRQDVLGDYKDEEEEDDERGEGEGKKE